MARKTGDKTDQRLHALVGLVLSTGGLAVLTSLASIIGVGVGAPPPWVGLAALVMLILVGDLLTVKVRIRSTWHGISWTDASVLVGLAIMPVAWVVLATVVGTVLANTVSRRPGLKFAFGVAKEAIVAGTGGLVLLGLDLTGSLAAPTSLPALALAFLVMTVVDPLLTVPVIAWSSRTRVVDRFRMNWDVRLVTNAGRFLVAGLAVLGLQLEQTLLYALPVLVLLAHLWHERWVRAREERQAWQDLAAATEAFTGVDLDVVLRESVVRGAKLFSADEIEVEVWLGERRRLVRGDDGITYDGDPTQAPPDYTSVYAVALHGYPGRRDIGALRLRFRHQVKITEREEAMAASFAAALDTAVRNAAAYQQLGEATQAHAYAAAHDALTGLANRRELERALVDALSDPQGMAARVAVMLIDLRHFKEVNDALGHLAGDRVLTEVARRLVDAAGPQDLVSRFGGDEFAVLLRSAWRPARVEARARRVLAALAEPVDVDGLPIMVEANGGVALASDPASDSTSDPSAGPASTSDSDPASDAPDDPGGAGADPRAWMAELLRRADVAMYQAKRTGQPVVRYAATHDPADRDRLTLAGQLPRAVAQREFVLHFQPIVDLASGQVIGAEALARWRHPSRGQLEPRWFLDLLERSAQLPAFTVAVLDDALSAAAMWRAAGHDLRVSVNISARSLLDAGLPAQVRAALDTHTTPPDRLCLELTETLALSQLDTVDQVLTQLHEIGVRLALDDFGTGFSSLAVLSRIPVHELKIDRSFVAALGDEADPAEPVGDPPDGAGGAQAAGAIATSQATAVVRSTVQLGRALDLAVVAEGIESDRQRRLLWALGCSAGQGHRFARPQPAERLLADLTHGIHGRPGTIATPLTGDGDATVVPLRPPRGSARRSAG